MTRTQHPAPKTTPAAAQAVVEHEAFAIGYHAYLWGCVYVKTMLLRDQATHPGHAAFAPVNALRLLPPHGGVLRAQGWLDLSGGPVLMHVPAMGQRYWAVQATDAALNCAPHVGSRSGSRPGLHAYCRRDGSAALPAGVARIAVPTSTVFIQLRSAVRPDVPGDAEAVAALLRAFTFEPLIPAPAAALPLHTPPRSADAAAPHWHTLAFFALLNEAVTRDNVVPGEESVAEQFAALGIGPGQRFDAARLTEPQRRGLQAGIDAASSRLASCGAAGGEPIGAWRFMFNLGQYGHDFLARSAAACFGYGADAPAEATCAFTAVDSQDSPLHGAQRYRIRFTKERLPPVDAFWSLTVCTRPDGPPYPDTVDAPGVGSLTPGLQRDADGAVEISVQHEAPADADAGRNWLPAPRAPFRLMLRLVLPRQPVLTRQYTPPPVQRSAA